MKLVRSATSRDSARWIRNSVSVSTELVSPFTVVVSDVMFPVATVRQLSLRDVETARLLYRLAPGSVR